MRFHRTGGCKFDSDPSVGVRVRVGSPPGSPASSHSQTRTLGWLAALNCPWVWTWAWMVVVFFPSLSVWPRDKSVTRNSAFTPPHEAARMNCVAAMVVIQNDGWISNETTQSGLAASSLLSSISGVTTTGGTKITATLGTKPTLFKYIVFDFAKQTKTH